VLRTSSLTDAKNPIRKCYLLDLSLQMIQQKFKMINKIKPKEELSKASTMMIKCLTDLDARS